MLKLTILIRWDYLQPRINYIGGSMCLHTYLSTFTRIIYYIFRYTTFGDISGNLNLNYNYIHTFIFNAIITLLYIIYSRSRIHISTMIIIMVEYM